jgi:hypothetical protein
VAANDFFPKRQHQIIVHHFFLKAGLHRHTCISITCSIKKEGTSVHPKPHSRESRPTFFLYLDSTESRNCNICFLLFSSNCVHAVPEFSFHTWRYLNVYMRGVRHQTKETSSLIRKKVHYKKKKIAVSHLQVATCMGLIHVANC